MNERDRLALYLRAAVRPVPRQDRGSEIVLKLIMVLAVTLMLAQLLGCRASTAAAARARADFPGCQVDDVREQNGRIYLRACGVPRAYLVTPVVVERDRR